MEPKQGELVTLGAPEEGEGGCSLPLGAWQRPRKELQRPSKKQTQAMLYNG